jgi:hypothetical protein
MKIQEKMQWHKKGKSTCFLKALGGNFQKLIFQAEDTHIWRVGNEHETTRECILLFELYIIHIINNEINKLADFVGAELSVMNFHFLGASWRPSLSAHLTASTLEGWSEVVVPDRRTPPPPPLHDPGGRYEAEVDPLFGEVR